MCFDIENHSHYNWAKKFENQWTWVTVSYNKETGEQYLYVNDELTTNKNGIKENLPFIIEKKLRKFSRKYRPKLAMKFQH